MLRSIISIVIVIAFSQSTESIGFKNIKYIKNIHKLCNFHVNSLSNYLKLNSQYHKYGKTFLAPLVAFFIYFDPVDFVTHDNTHVAYARNLPEDNGASGKYRGTPQTLAPIIQYKNIIQQALSALPNDIKTCETALNILPKNEKEFKKTFDEFSNGVSYKQQYLDKNAFVVYYTGGFDGVGRPSIEVDEDGESTKMSSQYGYRNEVWISMNDAHIDLDYIKSLTSTSNTKEYTDSINDIITDLKKALISINNYIQLAPSTIISDAENILKK